MDDFYDFRGNVPAIEPGGPNMRVAPAPDAEVRSDLSTSDLSTSDLFTILWLALADVLGTAAAATLLRRAAQRACSRSPELRTLAITRENLEYRYTVPSVWKAPAPLALSGLCELVRELWTLLVDLTGSVVVNRLAQIPELRERGIVPPKEAYS